MFNKATLSLLFLLFFSYPAFAEKRIAVIPFDVPDAKIELKQFGTGTADTITMALGSIKEFIMIDRGFTENILKEQAFQKSGFVDQESAIKLGKLIGAEVLVVGSIQYDAGMYRITSRMTDVETSKVIKSVQVTGNNIFDLQDKIAQEIIDTNQNKQPQPKTNTNNNNFTFATIQEPAVNAYNKLKKIIFNSTSNVSAYNKYNEARNSFLQGKEKNLKYAIYYYNQALDLDPKYTLALAGKAEALAYLASDYELNGKPFKEDMDKAYEIVKSIIEQDNQLPDVYKTLSLISRLRGNFEEGKKSAQKALSLNPNDAEAYYLLWANDPSPQKEDENLLKAVKINPYIVKRTISIAYAYFKQSKYYESINLYQQAIKLYPDYHLGYTGLGFAYYYINDFDKAEQNFKKSIELNTNADTAYAGLGLIKARKGEMEKAESLVKKAISLNNENSISHTSLGFIYLYKGEKEKALKKFKDALEVNPEDFYARDAIGLYYFENGDIQKAMEQYNEALRINPFDIAALYNIGNVYRAYGKTKEAIEKFNESLAIFPDFTASLLKIAELYENTGNYAYSSAYYQKVSQLEPSLYIFNKTGISLYNAKKYAEAETYYQKALQINPNDVLTINNLGINYYMQSKFDLAIKQYISVIKINPNDASAHENLAITYKQIGLNNESDFYYKKSCLLGSQSACEYLTHKNR